MLGDRFTPGNIYFLASWSYDLKQLKHPIGCHLNIFLRSGSSNVSFFFLNTEKLLNINGSGNEGNGLKISF